MQSEVSVYRASTRTQRGKRNLDEFIESFGRAILRLELMPIGDGPIGCDVAIRALPDVAIATGTASPMRNHHPIDDSNDDYVLCVLRRGAADFRYSRADAAMLSSEAVLTMNGEAGTFTGHTPTLLTNIRLKRELLSHRVVDADSVAGQRISSKEVALRLLLSYSDVLADPEANIDADTGRIITGNIYDLAALTIGPVDARAHMRGVRAARLYALKQDVRRNLVHASLSIGEVAQRHGISASYARRLFADANTSFSDYLLEQRLVAAHRLLTDPLRASMTISAVAYEVGFGDLSYFNRTFRRRFGMTPSEVRIVGSS